MACTRILNACIAFAALTMALAALAGCQTEEEDGADSRTRLEVLLTDAATDQYEEVQVTVERVEVRRGGPEGDWIVVGSPDRRYNLLDLINGRTGDLGMAELTAGEYDRVRLVLDEAIGANYAVLPDGSHQDLALAEGTQAGVEITSAFSVRENDLTTLILDFDASRSVVRGPDGGAWLLDPRLSVHEASASARITGTARYHDPNSTDAGALSGARISAQRMLQDTHGQVRPTATSATVSGDGGGYMLDAAPGDYTVVAVKTGYRSACGRVNAQAGADIPLALDLPVSETGSVSGQASIVGALEDAVISISVRADLDCDGDGEANDPVEITSMRVTNGSRYSFTLPTGTFSLDYAWEGDYGGEEIEIERGVDVERNIVFNQ